MQPSEDQKNASALKRALFAVKDMRSKLDAVEQAKTEPIAIVGMSCRFPGGANTPEAYWQLLHTGLDAIREVPADRWDIDAYYDPDPESPGKMYTREAGFIDQIDQFDAQFFGISPREAMSLDPQQRLLLEVSWEALEVAGLAPEKLVGSLTGVYIGMSTTDYSQMQLKSGDLGQIDAYIGTGGAFSVAAGRLSYILGLAGPALAVDTACSSSLVAVHLACQSLRSGQSNLALAGGVSLILAPESSVYMSKAKALAPDGRCKTFDKNADGYGRGEGCGVIVLKRLSDAVADGDNVLALIRGSAINHDGRSSGLTVPNGQAQQAVIRAALANAGGVEPQAVSFVETHGTGTPLGDPIEVRALVSALGKNRPKDKKLAIGSVKTNIGHLEAASGIAGLIKLVLSLQHQDIPRHLHLQELTPHIDWASMPVEVPTESRPWPMGDQARLAGVSSFGFSGTNAHVLLEEAPVRQIAQSEMERPFHLLTLSAKSEAALTALVADFENYLAVSPSASLENIAYTQNRGRSHFSHRIAIIGDSQGDIRDKLAAGREGQQPAGLIRGEASPVNQPKIAFLFTGQGSQYEDMGRQLYHTQPVFRAALDSCDELLRPYLAQPLLAVLFAEDGQALIHETAYTQPALFALEYALAQLWRSWGIKPAAVMGHSVGEYVAACVAGVLSLEDGLKLIAERGRLMQALPQNGAMAAILTHEERVAEAVAPYADQVAIAAVNGPENIVISGVDAAVQAIVKTLEEEGIKTRALTVSHAFHSPLMEPMLDAFTEVAASVSYGKSTITLISNVSGQPVSADEMGQASYWRQHVRQAVQFKPAMQSLVEQGVEIFLEIGPNPVLLGMGQWCLPENSGVWLSSLRKGQDDWLQMLNSLGRMYVQGVDVDWDGFDKAYVRQRLALPTYPFQRQRYWFAKSAAASLPAGSTQITLPDTISEPLDDWLYKVRWQAKANETGSAQPEAGNWLILADSGGVAEALATQLQAQGDQCLLVRPQDAADASRNDKSLDPTNPAEFQRLLQETLTASTLPLRGVIHLWGLDIPQLADTDLTSVERAQRLGVGSALHLIQAMTTVIADVKPAQPAAGSPRLWLVTRAAQSVTEMPTTPVHMAQSMLWGFGKTIALEHARFWGGLIDLDVNVSSNEAQALFAELQHTGGEQQVAFRNEQRYVARLVPTSLPSLTFDPGTLRTDGAYLISGGLGALGLEVARWFAKIGARRLILLGRTPLPARTSWKQIPADHPLFNKIEAIREIERLGATVHLGTFDVADEVQLVAFLNTYQQEDWPPIRGVIHAAGVVQDSALANMDLAAINNVVRPKAVGAWLLHQHLQAAPLDFFIMFSSLASLGGAAGQGNYAAANAFLDGLADYRRAMGQPALSINWGPWARIGMAAQKNLEEQRARRGIVSIEPAEGLAILSLLLKQDSAQLGVMPLPPAQMARLYPGESMFLTELLDKDTATSTLSGGTEPIKAQILAASPDGQLDLVTRHLQQRIGQVLMLDPAEIPIKQNVMELGLDSIMIMELIRQLDQDLQLTLYPREIFERPSIEDLAAYLLAELEQSDTTAPVETPGADSAQAKFAPVVQRPARQELQIPSQRNPSAVFLLSSPRSGSTLLRVMLAGHPGLFCPPELHLLPFATMAEREAQLAQSYLGEGLQRALMELTGLDASQSKARLETWLEQNLPIYEVYNQLQQAAGTRLLVDKSPAYGADIETLERAEAIFEKPKYIHLIRHPYAVMESFIRNRMDKLLDTRVNNPMSLAEQVWATTTSNTLDFLEQIDPERHYLLKFEDLVIDPEQTMQSLCEFLGLAYDPKVLTPYEGQRMTDGVHEQSAGIGDPNFLKHKGIDPTLAEAWKTVHLPQRPGGFTRRIADELGYELPWPLPVVEAAAKSTQQETPSIQPPGDSAALPLSFAQQRLWIFSQIEPESPAYNIPMAIKLDGMLNEKALGKSLNEIIRRHQTLRTNFLFKDNEPVQEIVPEASLLLTTISLEAIPADHQEAKVEQLALQEVTKPFDLTQDLKLRATLLRLETEKHVLIVTMHHISSDGWSIGIFLQELAALYEAFRLDQPSPLPDLDMQYVAYAQQQRQTLQGETLQTALAYWEKQLHNAPPLLELPTDRPRPAMQSHTGNRLPLALSAELTQALRDLSRSQGVTLYMTLLAIYKILLFRYTGQADILVGSPISGRNAPEIRSLIGFFVNMLVMRTDLSGDIDFATLLKRVRQVALEAFEHQDLPFDKLVEELSPARNLNTSPFFQTTFVLQNIPMPSIDLKGLTLTPLPLNTQTAKFDLRLSLTDTKQNLAGDIEYNTDLFDKGTISRMAGHFESLCESIVNNPNLRLSELTILTAQEQHQLLTEWNNTQADYPTDVCFHQLFEAQVERTPDAVAVVFGKQSLTFAQLNAQANQLAHYLRDRGVGPEELVGVCMERSLEMMVALLGIFKAGGGYVPLDPKYPQARSAHILKDSEIKVLLSLQHLLEALPQDQTLQTICMDSDREVISRESSANLPTNVASNNLAYVIYTSGSTGLPKGVTIEHRSMVNYLQWVNTKLFAETSCILPVITSLAFDASLKQLFAPLLRGDSVWMMPDDIITQPEMLFELFDSQTNVGINCVPSVWRSILAEIEAGRVKSENLKTLLVGGEHLDRDLVDKTLKAVPHLKIWNLYGPTESTANASAANIASGTEISIGRPLANTQLYILDAQLNPVPVGIPGELHIGGDGLARGYLNRPDLTTEKFISNPFSSRPNGRLYKTGDLTRFLPNGNIEFLGRLDHQVKIRGFRIELGEIESALIQYPGIRQCVVIVREDNPDDKRLVAYLVANGTAQPTMVELRDFLSRQLPDYMLPTAYVFVEAMPLTPTGKIDHKALPLPSQTRNDLGDHLVLPETPTEKLIADVWREALNIDQISVYDNFFDLGGHSLLSVRVMNQLEKETNVKLNLALMRFQTLGQLAAAYQEKLQPPQAATVAKAGAETAKQQPETLQLEPSPPPKQGAADLEPFYFGPSDAQLFGCFHRPESKNQQAYGIVLCYPFGQEYFRSHRAYLQLALRLSRAGFPVLRFDYFGCGDSAGDAEDGTMRQWLDNIPLAIEALKARSGLSKVHLVGLRLGAALAMLTATKRNDVSGLVLWEPVINGERYYQELVQKHKELTWYLPTKVEQSSGAHNAVELMGTPVSEALLADIRQLDLLSVQADTRTKTLIVNNTTSPLAEQLKTALQTVNNGQTIGTVTYQHIPSFTIWAEDPDKGLVPNQTLNEIVSWIAEVSS